MVLALGKRSRWQVLITILSQEIHWSGWDWFTCNASQYSYKAELRPRGANSDAMGEPFITANHGCWL
jgi:hypothetical protein